MTNTELHHGGEADAEHSRLQARIKALENEVEALRRVPAASEDGQPSPGLARAEKRIADLEGTLAAVTVESGAAIGRLQQQVKDSENLLAFFRQTHARMFSPSGALVIDDRVHKLIKSCLHPDNVTDPDKKQRFTEAFIAFDALPLGRRTEAEREAAEAQARMEAEERARRADKKRYAEEYRRQKQAEKEALWKRQVAARKGQETKRRNAEAKAQKTSKEAG